MTTRFHRWLVALCASFAAMTLQAEPLLNGISSYTKLGQEQFLAGLYLPSTTTDVGTALNVGGERRMELRITGRSVSARGLSRMWIEGIAINIAGDQLQANADGMVEFTQMTKGRLRNGDTVVIDDIPGEGISVTINGVEMGKIRRAPNLFNMLLATWVGSVPLSSEFRDAIMAGGNINPDLLARYRATSPTDERIAAVQEWKTPAAAPAQPAVAASRPAPVAAPSVSAPSVAAPTLAAAAAAKPEVSAPSAAAKPQVEQPKVEQPKVAQKKPEPKPTQVAAAKPVNNAFLDDDELEEEEEPLLTAASLVSRQLYHSKLLRWTYKNIRYPKRALQRGQEGSVRVAVLIDRNGKVMNMQALEESRHSLLNSEALKAVERSDPFPPMPQDLQGDRFEFTLPITFSIPKD
ncbi:TonB family protein [Simiduia sp. 21SJ11W-1]|uniref:TonB family protein n=1 Tax=Simiduia sp. 21SJ11W-1 TaxID=2909669 RepID=UPI0020A1BE02|nr:TonB family protein [Simiduia sp. 21SJ11W-1]UTA47292.1 TonB family protein [Simiduia sp. 21SJ11W-1]